LAKASARHLSGEGVGQLHGAVLRGHAAAALPVVVERGGLRLVLKEAGAEGGGVHLGIVVAVRPGLEEGVEVVVRAVGHVEEDVAVAEAPPRRVRARGAAACERAARELPPDACRERRASPQQLSKLLDARPALLRVVGISEREGVAEGEHCALLAQVEPGPAPRGEAALTAAATHDVLPCLAALPRCLLHLCPVAHPLDRLSDDSSIGQEDPKHLAELILEVGI